jgi:hypothetical protein
MLIVILCFFYVLDVDYLQVVWTATETILSKFIDIRIGNDLFYMNQISVSIYLVCLALIIDCIC